MLRDLLFTKKERRKLFLGVCTALVAAGVLGVVSLVVPAVRDWFMSLAKGLLAFGGRDVAVRGWVVILLAICSLFAVVQFLCWLALARRSPHIRLFRSLARDEQLVVTLLAKSDFGLTEGELSDRVPVSPQRFLHFIDRLVDDLHLAERTEPQSGGAFWALSDKGRKVAAVNRLFASCSQPTEQIETPEAAKANLKQKVGKPGQELERLRPKRGELEEGAEKLLKLLFDHRQPLSLPQIASGIGAPIGIAEYHRDKLWEFGMITSAGIAEQDYELMPEGREYVVKHLLKK